MLGSLFSLATLPLLLTCQKKVRCQNIPNSLRWQEAFGENVWKGLEIWLHNLLSFSSSLYNPFKRNIPLLMNATSHLFGAQLLSPERLSVTFYCHLQNRNPFRGPRRSIQGCFGAGHLSAIQGSDPTRLHSYKQPFSETQMLQLHCCKAGGG